MRAMPESGLKRGEDGRGPGDKGIENAEAAFTRPMEQSIAGHPRPLRSTSWQVKQPPILKAEPETLLHPGLLLPQASKPWFPTIMGRYSLQEKKADQWACWRQLQHPALKHEAVVAFAARTEPRAVGVLCPSAESVVGGGGGSPPDAASEAAPPPRGERKQGGTTLPSSCYCSRFDGC